MVILHAITWNTTSRIYGRTHPLMLLSKPKLKVLLILALTCSLIGGSVWHITHAPSAPTTPAVIEPGSLKDATDEIVYFDNDAITILARNGFTGQNDCSGTIDDVVIQCALGILANLPVMGPSASGTQGVTLFISRGQYQITHTLTWTTGKPITILGEGRNRSMLYLANNVNGDLFDITPSRQADINEVGFIKFVGNSANQVGTSICLNFGPNADEINIYHSEITQCLTAAVKIQSTNVARNSITETWFLSDGVGLLNFTPELRITGSKFAGTGIALQQAANASAGGKNSITGNVVDSKTTAIKWTGTKCDSTISDNVFFNAGTITVSSIINDLTISGNEFIGTTLTFTPQ